MEVDFLVLDIKSLPQLFYELCGKAEVVKVVENGVNYNPEEVDYNVW